jgi:hypothetical protein
MRLLTKATRPLNEVLEMGPNLLPENFAIHVRFRLHFAVITNDITQTFLELTLDVKERGLTRFFWYRITQDSERHYDKADENDLPIHKVTLWRKPVARSYCPQH